MVNNNSTIRNKKGELIEELKELRVQKGMTYQQIYDEIQRQGGSVSLSTIKLVFSDKRNHEHDYNNVLKPISDALSSTSDDVSLEKRILLTRLELKEERIKELEERLEKKEVSFKERENFYKEQIDFFKSQTKSRDSHINNRDVHIHNLDDHIKALNQAIARKDALIKALYEQLMDIEITPFKTEEER
jgi:uncharacterized protein (DUF3084 family)